MLRRIAGHKNRPSDSTVRLYVYIDQNASQSLLREKAYFSNFMRFSKIQAKYIILLLLYKVCQTAKSYLFLGFILERTVSAMA